MMIREWRGGEVELALCGDLLGGTKEDEQCACLT